MLSTGSRPRARLAAALFLLLALSLPLAAEQSASDKLREQAKQLQADIELLNTSKAELSSAASKALLDTFDKEIEGKKALLAKVNEQAKEAESLEADIQKLKALEEQYKDHASPEFLAALRKEIQAITQQAQKPPEPEAGEPPPARKDQESEKGKPVLKVSPSRIDFGDQDIGATTETKSVTFSNAGDVELRLKEPPTSMSTEEYKIEKSTCSNVLNPGAECMVEVTFTPNARGFCESGLVFTPEGSDLQPVVVTLTGTGRGSSTGFTRSVMGADISASSSKDTEQQFFVEANLNAPLGCFNPTHHWGCRSDTSDPLEKRLWAWLNPRISSLPKPSTTLISDLTEQSSFLNPTLSTGQVSDITQGLEFLGGLEYFLIKPREGIPFGGRSSEKTARLSVALVAGGGVITPFSSEKTAQMFKLTDRLKNLVMSDPGLFPALTSQLKQSLNCISDENADPKKTCAPPTTVAFVSRERSRFFRQYYFGFRLKTYFFQRDRSDSQGNPVPLDIFPGIFDITVGQNEFVTGGHLRGVLLRLESVYPLPFAPAFNIFGSAYLRLKSNKTLDPTILAPPDTNSLTLSSPEVIVQPLGPLDRDYFRIGLGVDLVQLIKGKRESGGAAPKK